MWAQEYHPVLTKEIAVVDTFYQQYVVEDDFRWLEDVESEATKNWVKLQDKLSNKYLSRITNTSNVLNDIKKYRHTEYELFIKKGKYYFTYGYYNRQANPALYYQTTSNPNMESDLLVDPNFISGSDQVMLKGYWVSKDSELLVYQFSRNGSDWAEAKVVSLENGNHLKDHLTGLRFSSIAWLGDGFFYSTYNLTDQFGKAVGQKVFYHKIGTKQEEDKLVFERKNNPSSHFSYITTHNERFFVLTETNEKIGKYNIFYIDYESDEKNIRPLLIGFHQAIYVLESHEGKLIAQSFYHANNGVIFEFDPVSRSSWRAITPEYSDALLLNVIPFADRIVAVYQSDQQQIISVFDYTGKVLHSFKLPLAWSIHGFNGEYSDEELFFYYTSYTVPPIVYKFNIINFTKKLNKQTIVTFDFEKIEYESVEYLSKDGTKVSMTLVHKKGLKLDGKNPTLLKTYGGFGIVSQPSFDPGIVYFVKKGGIFAYANIRGGGDKGVEWTNAGKGDNKQNSFDDFIAAAEFLIEKKYTNSEKLAITGASNGGLVVAASAIQRPDLFKVVIPVVAPLDMLRFEQFSVGHFHLDEYGTVTDSLSFLKLLAYSPYHNIKEKVNYPAMLVITSENDDRVPPFNSYKFVASLQRGKGQANPILLKVEKDSGHSGSSTYSSSMEWKADFYGFILNELKKK